MKNVTNVVVNAEDLGRLGEKGAVDLVGKAIAGLARAGRKAVPSEVEDDPDPANAATAADVLVSNAASRMSAVNRLCRCPS